MNFNLNFLLLISLLILSIQPDVYSQDVQHIHTFERPNFNDIENIWITKESIRKKESNGFSYLLIDIEHPPCNLPYGSEVIVQYVKEVNHKVTQEIRLNKKFDSTVRVINWSHSMNLHKDLPMGWFFCSIEPVLGGLDPIEVQLIIFYEDQLYTFKGILPIHNDFEWENTYTFTPDESLKLRNPDAHSHLIKVWDDLIQRYKKHFQSH